MATRFLYMIPIMMLAYYTRGHDHNYILMKFTLSFLVKHAEAHLILFLVTWFEFFFTFFINIFQIYYLAQIVSHIQGDTYHITITEWQA